MRVIAKGAFGLLALAAVPLTACSQTPGTRLKGGVEVVNVEVKGDTTTIRYRVHADPATPEPFFSLTLPLMQPPILVRADTTGRLWHSSPHVGRYPVASWAYIGDAQMLTSPSLDLTTIGVPGLADAWIEGYHEPLEEGTPEADSAGADTTGYQYGARKIRVVGVGPRASSLSRDQLLARTEDALDERCGAGAGIPRGICTSLTAKLTAAKSALARGDATAARGQVAAFAAELTAQRGKGLDETTYWLLSALAGLVTSRL